MATDLHLHLNAHWRKRCPIVRCNLETFLVKDWLCTSKYYSAASTSFFCNKSVCVKPLISLKYMTIYADSFSIKRSFKSLYKNTPCMDFSVHMCALTHLHTHLTQTHFRHYDSICPCWPVSESVSN